jgi:FkbM family methyltransferase
MAHYGEWAEPELSIIAGIVRPGDVVVEAGSNIGIHTLPIARMVGETGTVHAYEPLVCNNQLLNANIIGNGFTNIRSYQMGVGETTEIMNFPQPWPDHRNNFGAWGLYSTKLVPNVTMMPCAVVSLDSLALPRLDFIKIDVEGHEREVVLGAMESIATHRPALLVETMNHYSMSQSEDGYASWMIDRLRPLNYSFWNVITPLFNSQNWKGLATDVFNNIWSFDMLCLPAERFDVAGLDNAETARMQELDPNRWRSVNVTRRS